MSNTTRISRFSDPARGGRRVEFRTWHSKSTVKWSRELTKETTREWWRDVGTLMDEVKDHVKEQPTNKWKQRLIDAGREAARS